MNRIRIDILVVLLTFVFLQGSFYYPQGSRVVPGKPSYEYINSNRPTGKSESDYYRINRKNTVNYFKTYEAGTLWNGKHWIPDNFPLKIFVCECSSENYKDVFRDYIDYALKVWQQADPRIEYGFVNSPGNADIIIRFEDNLMKKYDINFLGLTDYELGPDRQIQMSTVEISLLKYDDKLLSDGEIKATIVHEMGHALGLGHSNNSVDLMYPYIDPESSSKMDYDELSGGDIEAIRSVIDLAYKYTWK